MDKLVGSVSNINSVNKNLLSPCNCQQNATKSIDHFRYDDFFYFNDQVFRNKFDLIGEKVQKILGSKQRKRFRSSIPENYYVRQENKIVDTLISTNQLIAIPNPFQYSRLIYFLRSNWDKIQTILSFSNGMVNNWQHTDNCSHLNNLATTWTKEVFNCSIGFRVSISFKIDEFHNSVYTHIVDNLIEKWAKIVFSKDPEKLDSYLKFGASLDECLRNCQFNKAKGLNKGAMGFQLFAEIFLTMLDFFINKELKAKKINFKYVRNGDEYMCFFPSRTIAEKSLTIMQTTLLENKFNIDFANLQKQRAPFNFVFPVALESCFHSLKTSKSSFALLDQLQKLQELENTGKIPEATKDFLAFLGKKISETDLMFNQETLQAYLNQEDNLLVLFNLQQQRPDLTKYIAKLVVPNFNANSNLWVKIKQQLEEEIIFDLNRQNADEEIIAQIYFADCLGINLSVVVLETVLTKWKEVSTIVVLTVLFYLNRQIQIQPDAKQLQDLWKNKDDLFDEMFSNKKKELDMLKQFGTPYSMIKNVGQTEYWMLMYEVVARCWYDGDFKQTILADPFFNFLRKQQITFLMFERENKKDDK